MTHEDGDGARVDIRFARSEDATALMTFIDEHWSPGHVLATSRRLFDWQHGGTDGRDFDYVIAVRGDEILGVLGFILTSRYDPRLADARALWLALWKVRDDAPGALGIRLLSFLENRVPHALIGSVGVRGEVIRLYRALGYDVGRMRRFYVLHPAQTRFVIVQAPDGAPRIREGCDDDPPALRPLSADAVLALQPSMDDAWPSGMVPLKSARYFVERFLRHPFYAYDLYAVERGDRMQGMIVVRACEVGNARVLRVVDGFLPPEALPGLGSALQSLIVSRDAEFADLLATGLDEAALSRSGLIELDANKQDIVLPNYFEPLVRKNSELTWAYKPRTGQSVVSFKADADQDRPNRVS